MTEEMKPLCMEITNRFMPTSKTSLTVNKFGLYGFMLQFVSNYSNVSCSVILENIDEVRGLIEVLENTIKLMESDNAK